MIRCGGNSTPAYLWKVKASSIIASRFSLSSLGGLDRAGITSRDLPCLLPDATLPLLFSWRHFLTWIMRSTDPLTRAKAAAAVSIHGILWVALRFPWLKSWIWRQGYVKNGRVDLLKLTETTLKRVRWTQWEITAWGESLKIGHTYIFARYSAMTR